jgi:hypothetical protein
MPNTPTKIRKRIRVSLKTMLSQFNKGVCFFGYIGDDGEDIMFGAFCQSTISLFRFESKHYELNGTLLLLGKERGQPFDENTKLFKEWKIDNGHGWPNINDIYKLLND